MKTRASNRTKKPLVQTYSFSASPSPSSPPAPASPDDKTSTPPPPTPSSPSTSNFQGSSQNKPTPRKPRRTTKAKASSSSFSAASAAFPGTYLDLLESVTSDASLRGYAGPYDRSMRGQTLINMWFGPRTADIRIAQKLLDRWINWTVLPPKYVPCDEDVCDASPWAARDFFARQAAFAKRRQEAAPSPPPGSGYTLLVDEREKRPYEMPRRDLRVVMGPFDEQREYLLRPGDALAVSQAWVPLDQGQEEDVVPGGWILDAGGIVTGLDWCPGRRGGVAQTLALAVVPHSDQEAYDYEAELARPDFQKHGTVQLWAFEGDDVSRRAALFRPSTQTPRLRKTLCLDCGRARRVRWCPEPSRVSDVGSLSHSLAVLCGDGHVYVIEDDDGGNGSFVHVTQPAVVLALNNEASVKATSMAWATFNRLVIGYSDGSVALWSVQPRCMLSRQPVHHSLVVDVATGYPSHPFLVASTPVGGTTKLVDLTRPTYETTEVQINAVSWQPNLLAYSDHLQGFFSVYPSANALNTMVSFMHQRFFPIVRRIFIGESYNSCLAVGRTHPFLLIGTTDGSLWCLNPQVELFHSRREPTDRLRVFQHEHRSKELFARDSPASERGASRIVHGFAIEKSRNPKAEMRSQSAKKQMRPNRSDMVDTGEANDEEEEAGGLMDPTRGIVYEPLSRVTTVEWNPNEGFGCWAAAAMASGLVRVMDLGLDNAPD